MTDLTAAQLQTLHESLTINISQLRDFRDSTRDMPTMAVRAINSKIDDLNELVSCIEDAGE